MAKKEPSIIPVLASDLPTIAQFMYELNLAQPTNQFLFYDWPNEPAQMSLYLDEMKRGFENPSKEMYKAVDEASGEMIAYLILTRKAASRNDSSALAQPAVSSIPVGVNIEFQALLRRTLDEMQKEVVLIDHFYLSSIFVKPSSRDKGLGSKLVKLCVDRAAAAKLPLFLSSAPSAKGFYEKLGFVHTAHGDIDLNEWGPKYGGFGIYRIQGMKGP